MTGPEAVAALRTIRACVAAGKARPVHVARLLYTLGVCFVDSTYKPVAVATSEAHRDGLTGANPGQVAAIAALNLASGALADAVAMIEMGTAHGAALSGKTPPTHAQIVAAVKASAS